MNERKVLSSEEQRIQKRMIGAFTSVVSAGKPEVGPMKPSALRDISGVSSRLTKDKSHLRVIGNYLKYHGATFKTILDDNGGAGMGFDVLRLALAILILLVHSSWIVGTSGVTTSILNFIFHIGPEPISGLAQATLDHPVTTGVNPNDHHLTGLGRPITLSYLPMFFALSGFLVTGSALRTGRLIPFLGLRVLRLLPALLVEVTLSAIILGATFTQLPLSQYYSSPMFWSYFWNIVGDVHLFLPEVFTDNNTNVVNSNLWTLPWELQCYMVMSVMIITGALLYRNVLVILFGIVTVVFIYESFVNDFQVVPAQVEGPTLVYYFVAGVLMFLWRDKVVFHGGLFLVSAVLCYILMMSPKTVFIYPVLLTYITVFIGLFPFPRFSLIKSGDYSYGIYLYGFPVTQAVFAVSLLMGFSQHGNLAVIAPLGVLATAAFAALSWHGVEKHCLKFKRYLSPKSSKIDARLHPSASAG